MIECLCVSVSERAQRVNISAQCVNCNKVISLYRCNFAYMKSPDIYDEDERQKFDFRWRLGRYPSRQLMTSYT